MKDNTEYIIYLATSPSGKQYVGQTKQSLNVRINGHVYDAKKGEHDYKFYRAIRKYGIENINFIVIDVVDGRDEANEAEIKYVAEFDTYHNGYNCTEGGQYNNHKNIKYIEGEIIGNFKYIRDILDFSFTGFRIRIHLKYTKDKFFVL